MPYETRVAQTAQELATLYKDWELLRRHQEGREPVRCG